MAGSGTKLWSTGDLVTASEFQTYLQDQVVSAFADSSARDAAFGGAGEPTLAEGMLCFLKDTNELQIYSGSAWIAILDIDLFDTSKIELNKDSGSAYVKLTTAHDTEATTPQLTFRKADNTVASPQVLDDNAVLGTIEFQGYDSNSYAAGARIQALVDGAPADGDMPTELIFQVTPDGGSETPATAMTIKPDAKVGIGSTTPVTALEVASDDDLTDFTSANRGAVTLTNTDHDANDYVALDFRYSTGATAPSARIAAKMTGGGSELVFGTSNTYGGVTNEAMDIGTTGLVTFPEGNWGAETTGAPDWTPTTNNISIGNGSIVAEYTVAGNIVHWAYQCTWGSTTSCSGSVSISVPIADTDTITYWNSGECWFQVDGGNIYIGHNLVINDFIYFYPNVETGSYVRSLNVNATVPFGWDTGDVLYATGFYRVTV